MGADFLKLTDFRTKVKYRVRISEIAGYSKLAIPEAYGEPSTIVDVNTLLTADQIPQLEVTETPEEIDEMLFRAKYSTAAVVSRAEPAGTLPGIITEEEKK